jgi:phosphodiesterase/alkaline phosphatase D-like protein
VWSGAVTEDGATVTARLNADAEARLLVGRSADLDGARATPSQQAHHDDNDRILSFSVDGLRPRTRYHYGIEVDGTLDGNRLGTFKTMGGGQQSFKLTFAGCARVGSNGAVFDAIREEQPDLHLILGDMFYANIVEDARGLFLDQYDRSLGTPAQGALYRSTPVAYVWDDHDFGGDGSDSSADSRGAAREVYREAVPHYELPAGPDGAIYQAFTVGRVRFIVMDTRSERVPGADGTMLGDEQLAWLKRELAAAGRRYPMTVLVSSVPWIAEAEEGADSWGGFAEERAEISRFIARHRIPGFLMLSADAHMLAIDDGTHSDYSGTGRAGFPVMHAAALDRPGSVKGGPYSEGTFPGGGQYGAMTVDDRGRELEVRLVGRDYRGDEIVSYAYSVPASP